MATYIPTTDVDVITGVRQFRLINATGAIYNMTRPERLLHDPRGLGWGEEVTTQRLGMTYYTTEKKEKQSTPSGEMVFRTYRAYAEFLSFCQVGGLVLCYKPVSTWYYLPVSIQIEKTEIKPDTNHLVCPVSFTGLSYWRERVVAQTRQGDEEDTGKIYAYTYGYTYGTGRRNVFDFELVLPSYYTLTIFGPVSNPSYVVTQDGETVNSGTINTTIQAGHKLVINTDPNEMEIAEYTTAGEYVANQYGNSDFTTRRIFELPRGASRMTVTSNDITTPVVVIEVKKHV